jgi:DNA-binding transcriptional MerR regulator
MKKLDLPLEHFREDLFQISPAGNDDLLNGGEILMERKYHTKQLNIDRGTFHHWRRSGLIPYDRAEGNGWQKFSFVECTWLKVIEEFRSLGLSLNYIKKVKDAVFDQGYDLFLLSARQVAQCMVEAALTEEEKAEALIIKQDLENMTGDEYKKNIAQEQESLFFYLILISLCTHSRYFLTINKQGLASFHSDADEIGVTEDGERFNIHSEVSSQSHVQINIYNIICELLQSKEISLPPQPLEESFTEEEKNIIGFIRDNEIQEVAIEKGVDGKPTIIRLTRNQVDSKVLSKLYPFLKKGNFTDWSFGNRDGKLIKYQNTEVIKLKK